MQVESTILENVFNEDQAKFDEATLEEDGGNVRRMLSSMRQMDGTEDELNFAALQRLTAAAAAASTAKGGVGQSFKEYGKPFHIV